MRPRGKILSVIISVVAMAHAASSAAVPVAADTAGSLAAAAVFAQAKTHYQAGKFDSTIIVLRAYIKKNGKNPANEHIVPLLLEALSRKGDIESSPKLIAVFLNRFPQSVFIPRIRYLEGMTKTRLEDYLGAVISFSLAATAGLSPQMDSLVAQNVRMLCEKSLPEPEIEQLASRTDLHPLVADPVRYYWAVKLLQSGRSTDAQKAASDLLKNHPRSVYAPMAKDLIARSSVQQKGTVSVGVLVPLSGTEAEIGKKVLQGVQLAVERFNQNSSVRINLIITDTRGSAVETALRTRDLVENSKVPLIIGPVHSEMAVVCASVLMGKDIAMITPTATEDGIADLGPLVFQLNPPIGVLGRRIAGYAMNNLNLKEFAILSPNSDYGRVLADNFKALALKNGGEVLFEAQFEEGANDYRPQLQALRSVLIQRRLPRNGLEGLSQRTTSRGLSRSDSAFFADSTMAVGGIFIPAETEDVVMIAAQMAFLNIRAQFLGATGWHNLKTIEQGKHYVNNAVIVTAEGADTAGQSWQEFQTHFSRRFSVVPDRVSALGFDAADIACKAIGTIGATPSGKQIAEVLHKLRTVKGYAGLISFDPDKGANQEAAIFKISDKKFVRVQ